MSSKLVCADAKAEPRIVKIDKEVFMIGRRGLNDLQLEDGTVSRFHAQIIKERSHYVLLDRNSKHGTYINGQRVNQAVLSNNDRIRFGSYPREFTFTIDEDTTTSAMQSVDALRTPSPAATPELADLSLFLDALTALGALPVLDDLLRLVIDSALRLMGAEHGCLLLLDEKGDLALRAARRKRGEDPDTSALAVSQAAAGEVIRSGRALISLNAASYERFRTGGDAHPPGLRRMVCLPLKVMAFDKSKEAAGPQRIIGALYVDSLTADQPPPERLLRAFEALAAEAAVAIETARLHKESLEKRKLEEELSVAREIQQSLLPKPVRHTPYLEVAGTNSPSRWVSGDYFDYLPLEDERFGFIVADVSGKGMPAAILASVLQGAFRAQAHAHRSPAEVVRHVNSYLIEPLRPNKFVTVFYGIISPAGELVYTSAGHNPALLFTVDGSVKELSVGGLMVGLFGFAQYEEQAVQLSPGDTVVVFSDGVIEAKNAREEPFGKNRLIAMARARSRASAERILEDLLDGVMSFSRGTPPYDDMTLMVIKYTGRAA